MELPLYQVDSFTTKVFHGNPACVCILPQGQVWPPTKLLQKIAQENYVAETVFCIKQDDSRDVEYLIRWFTPEIEMDLCGHATLAAAHIIFGKFEAPNVEQVTFISEYSGRLEIKKCAEGQYEMLLPRRPGEPADLPKVISDAFGEQKPLEVYKSRDYMLIYKHQAEIQALKPNQSIMDRVNLDPGGVICTAKADPDSDCDFVSRFFTPQCSVFEDPVTGSAHCTLVPFWAQRLGKKDVTAHQISPRSGELFCTDMKETDQVKVRGNAVTYFEGKIVVPDH